MSVFQPYQLAGLALPNRIVMAPMTRSRAKNNSPDDSTATYYAQRASAGLIISEGAVVSTQGRGYLWTPGIHTPEQVADWKKVTKAVHDAHGRIFVQLWHVGRMSHTSLQDQGAAPVSSVDTRVSAAWPVFAYDDAGQPAQVQPSAARALKVDEIPAVIEDFRRAALNAIEAGFDGIELHAAGAYLFDQFINAGLNKREDRYGGESIDNRLRVLLETVDVLGQAIGSHRVAVRISPEGRLKDGPPYESEHATYLALARELSERKISYLHINNQGISEQLLQGIRSAFDGTLMITGELTLKKAAELIDEGTVDLVGFGRPFIGNPDLVERFRNGWPLVTAERDVYYGGGDEGYIDFPAFER